MSFKYKVFLLIILAFLTRFVGLNWGGGFLFHPDENNMATALSQLDSQNLNPHFFAYGQFPLYLGHFTLKVFSLPNNFVNSIIILRVYSALFSLLSLYFFYKVYPHLVFILLLIFTPGLIQLAHFGTTESLLILTFIINLYLAKLIMKKAKFIFFIIAAFSTAIAAATKISGAIFIFPIIVAALYARSWYLIPYGILCLLFTIALSPYNLLAFPDFISTMRYETQVATGLLPVFYTTQFQNSLPYIFQITKIFPYVNGWPVFLFALLSIPYLVIKNKKYSFIIFLSCLIYFLYFGQLYVKWTRFMSPIFFVLPLLASIYLRRFPRLLPLALVPGVLFFTHYFFPDTRLTASQYLVSQLPKSTTVISESGNVVNLPVLPNNLNIINYDFYSAYPSFLSNHLMSADYLIVPSRRVFKNHNLKYYENLFNGKLGFQEIKIIKPWSDFFLNPENAEETWSVFDRPSIRIYQKNIDLSLEQYEQLL
jgi:hypothetical protein